MESRLISIVVPVFNEQFSLEGLWQEIHEVAASQNLQVQTVFVDDGSTDDSWGVISRLAEADSRVGGIRFRSNVGKAAALMAGFAAARGQVVITMDADLQDPPAEIPRLLQGLDNGFDVVSGWKQHRLDPWHKVYPSWVFNKLIGWLTGVKLHDHVCGLKAYRIEAARQLRIYGELHRFLTVFAAAKGFRVTEIPTRHRPRTTGVGKYGFARFTKGFLDLITVLVLIRYRWRPQHLIGSVGVWAAILGAFFFAICLFLGRHWGFLGAPLAGLILIAVGLVAEIIIHEHPLDGLYDVSERVGWCQHTGETPVPHEARHRRDAGAAQGGNEP
ncbi:MAG TPA: glycosyltransferase family 2 protein [Phycisphaerae bacterium]|nr:glycosyltransferase family 2 protein [Phycisphaerae bacterium]